MKRFGIQTIVVGLCILISVLYLDWPSALASGKSDGASQKSEFPVEAKRAKTIGRFVEAMAPYIDASTTEFVKTKIRGQEHLPIQISSMAGGRVSMTVERSVYSFQFTGKTDDGRFQFKIQNRPFTYDISESDEVLWTRVQEILSPRTALESGRSLIDNILVPRAEAYAGLPLALLAGGTGAAVFLKYSASRRTCEDFERLMMKCNLMTLTRKLDAESILAMTRNFVSEKEPAFCTSTGRARHCLQAAGKTLFTGDRIKEVPMNMRDFFELSTKIPYVPKPASPGKPSSVKTQN